MTINRRARATIAQRVDAWARQIPDQFAGDEVLAAVRVTSFVAGVSSAVMLLAQNVNLGRASWPALLSELEALNDEADELIAHQLAGLACMKARDTSARDGPA